MINPQRLSKLIMSRDHKNSQDYLLEVYENTSEEEKELIKKDMEKIRNERN